ncbi:U11/U12 small nuclear ribonucleoprotein 25 kDa protein isoform X2 [Orussus abietinus]|nr:U11/U12 small nuclear ribonucleoprotein 25 kDa protein isoform X2 [Orussus abietinus]
MISNETDESTHIEEQPMTEKEEFSHTELVKLTKEALEKIIESDPLFSGLPADVTIEELRAQTAVAQGQAITLFLNRGELPKLAIVVPLHNTTVLDLKKAIRRHTNLALKRKNVQKKVSWKHVWKKYHIMFNDVPLTDDSENIRNYGISNKVELHYSKRRRRKNKVV